uniref:ABC-type xenobiotic transporter n=1 Tax=Panagrellus redivivus TaxID=6233 RepID=A0A7E4WBD5_PANRE
MGAVKHLRRRRHRKEVAKPHEVFEPASFRQMLRYAKRRDYFLLALGIATSIITGLLVPVTCVIMRGVYIVLLSTETQIETLKGDPVLEESIDYFVAVVMQACGFMAINGTAMLIFGYISMYSFYILCERQIHRIRKAFFKSVLSQDMEWFDAHESGTITQKLTVDIERIRNGMSDKLGIVILAFSTLFFGCAYALYLDWRLALVLISLSPLMLFSIFLSSYVVTTVSQSENVHYNRANAIAEEVIAGIRTVLAFNGQAWETQRYRHHLDKGEKTGTNRAIVTGLFSGLYMTVLFTCIGMAFWYGVNRSVNGHMEPNLVFTIFWSIILGAFKMGQALPNFSVIATAKVAAGEIFGYIDRKPRMTARVDGVPPHTIKGDITFKDVKFTYPTRRETPILHGLSFNIRHGDHIAFVGHSGSGKSTIFQLLLRFYEHDSGDILIDEHKIQDLPANWLRRMIGVVSQNPIIFSGTVEQNIRIGNPAATTSMILEACNVANAHCFIKELPLGYETIIGEGGIGLSGGQKQRIAIARALVRNPKILLLDEATSALDNESEALVKSALIKASAGRTTITIAHRLSTVENANKIFVFDKGEIVESGDHEELLATNGHYHQLVTAQQIQDEVQDDDSIESSGSSDDETDASEDRKRHRFSARLSRSIANVHEAVDDVENMDIEEAMKEEGANQASLVQILRFCRPELPYIIAGTIFSVIRGFQWPMFTVLLGQLFKALSLDSSEDALRHGFIIGITFVIVGVIGGVMTLAAGWIMGKAGERMAKRLRIAVYSNILRQDGTYFDQPQHTVGKLTTRLATDAHNVQAAVDQRFSEVIQGAMSLLLGVLFALYTDILVAVVCLASAVVLAVIQIVIISYLKKRGAKDAQYAEVASHVASEAINGVKTVQMMCHQESVYNKFSAASHIPHKRALTRGLFQSFNFALSIAFTDYNFAVAYSTGALLVKAGWATPYTVFQVIEALHMAATLIVAASNFFPEYIKARISAGIMFQMLSDQPSIDSTSDGGLKKYIKGEVSFDTVRFAYPNGHRRLAVHNLSFKAEPGQTVALVGASGCGKSTSIQLLERFYDPSAGSIKIDDIDIREHNLQSIRNAMAIVSQEPVLFNVTIKENIAYARPQATMDEIVAAAEFAHIHSFIQALPQKYDTVIGGHEAQLSGGQKQRIAVARAILRNPKILLLDEATSALDTESEMMLQGALNRARIGRTCIIVAHRLSTIQQADKIIVMRDGTVVESGTHVQLLARNGTYAKLISKQ